MWKCKENEKIVRIKTVGTSAERTLELKNQVFTSFVWSWLVMIWLLTPASIVQVQTQNPIIKKVWKMKELPKTCILSENQLKKSDKKTKNVLLPSQNNPNEHNGFQNHIESRFFWPGRNKETYKKHLH